MKNSLLWRITGDEVRDSYVFGTMHVKSEEAFGRIEQVKKIISNVDLFCAEYNLDQMGLGQSNAHLLMKSSDNLLDYLSEKRLIKIRNIIKKAFNIDLNHLRAFLPIVVVNLISESILSQKYQYPLDLFLWKYAKEKKVTVSGIESIEEQIAVLESIDLKTQVKMLKSMAKNVSRFRSNILKVAQYYESEEIKKLYRTGKKSLGKHKNELLWKRNINMSERFYQQIKNHSVFLAIGAGHLYGDKGVLALLRRKGIKAKAIKHKNPENE